MSIEPDVFVHNGDGCEQPIEIKIWNMMIL